MGDRVGRGSNGYVHEVVIQRIPHQLLSRLDEAFPNASLSASRDVTARRARAWAWPAVQIGLAAGLAHLVAGVSVPSAQVYAPIVAVGAIGLGRERRMSRSALMIAGLFLGVVAAELATPLVGNGWWQVGAMVVVTALAAGTLIDRDLAVTYAVINAIVLVALPGSEGWVPDRLVAGALGALVALVVLLLVVPPRSAHLIRRRLRRATDLSAEALDQTAALLRGDTEPALERGDERPLITAARRLDDEIERSHESADQAREIVRWSPIRRRERPEVERLARIAHELRPALRTASTIARLGDRAALTGVQADHHVVNGIGDAAEALESLVAALLDGDAPPPGDDEHAAGVVEHVLSRQTGHALLIALQEEVRGLLADVSAILAREFENAASVARERAVGVVQNGIAYGAVDGPAAATDR